MFNPEKTKWYKQSSAGNMLYLSMPWLSIQERMRKATGFAFPNDVFFLVKENDRVVLGHYIDYEENLKQAEAILDAMDSDSGRFRRFAEAFYSGGRSMIEIGKKLEVMPIDDPDFSKTYSAFIEQNHVFWEHSLFLDALDPVEEQAINRIFGEGSKTLGKNDINLLLSPNDPSNLQKEQAHMLEIYGLAKSRGAGDAEVLARLKKHAEEYHWIRNDYEKVSYLDGSYFRGVLDTWLANPILAEEAQKVVSNMKQLGDTKAALIASLGLDEKIASQLDVMNLFTNLRDDRKKYNCISSYYLDVIAGKIAQRAGLEKGLALWANVYELPDLTQGSPVIETLKQRSKFGSVSYSEGNKVVFETGEGIRGLYDQFEAGLQKTEIRGNTANPGKAIGTAKVVVGQDDFNKMEKDDILVTSMTRPEFLPIMKLAAAIVTDEGGITCHAAIVARELGIPCVIGTQVATKMLKDGDKVEVNANHGTVIKL